MGLLGRTGGRAQWDCQRSDLRLQTLRGLLFVFTAQPVLYWCARNMSFWSSISFNLAVLMNLLVAFFYPFKGVRGGTRIFNFKATVRSSRTVMTCILNVIPGSVGAILWGPPYPFSDKMTLQVAPQTSF